MRRLPAPAKRARRYPRRRGGPRSRMVRSRARRGARTARAGRLGRGGHRAARRCRTRAALALRARRVQRPDGCVSIVVPVRDDGDTGRVRPAVAARAAVGRSTWCPGRHPTPYRPMHRPLPDGVVEGLIRTRRSTRSPTARRVDAGHVVARGDASGAQRLRSVSSWIANCSRCAERCPPNRRSRSPPDRSCPAPTRTPFSR